MPERVRFSINQLMKLLVRLGNESLRPHRLARPRTSDFHSGNRGSNPLGVNNESLAQLVEHITFNDGVDGSSPSRLISFFSRLLYLNFFHYI